MNITESIILALESIVANKTRAALTMLGIIIGVGAVICMLALASGAKESMMSSIQSMGTNNLTIMSGQSRNGGVRGGMGSMQSLTLSDVEALRKASAIGKLAPQVQTSAQVKYANNNTNTSIYGTTPEYADIRNYTVEKGRFIRDNDVKGLKKVAVIGPTTAETLFGEMTPVGKTISIKGIKFEVVGLLKSKGSSGFMNQDDIIIIPLTTAMRRLMGTKYLGNINVQATDMSKMNTAEAQINKILRKEHKIKDPEDDDFRIFNQNEIMEMANQTSQTFTLLLGGIACVSLLVGGIGVMNIMLVSVTERTKEIGIRKALGAKNSNIQSQFLIESLMLSIVGGIIGIIFGVGVSQIMSALSTFTASVSVWSILMSFGFSCMVGIFFGYYPAKKASQLDPIECLRYE
ncbi:MAG: ABC transporter permease [Abditibacteriota bacterium]|nr:ABC transporter permease [Abditibacteriota bacterium]